MAYTDLVSVKAELKISTATTTDDTLLNGYITLAQRIIEAPRPFGTSRLFEVASDSTKYFDAPWHVDSNDFDSPAYVLDLRNLDLCAVTSVTNGDGVLIPAAAYVTAPRDRTPYYAIRLKRAAGYIWTWSGDSPEGTIAIVGKWGYSTAAPADIARCALRIACWCYRSRDNAGFDVDIKTEEGIILGARMPRDIRDIIEAYWSLV